MRMLKHYKELYYSEELRERLWACDKKRYYGWYIWAPNEAYYKFDLKFRGRRLGAIKSNLSNPLHPDEVELKLKQYLEALSLLKRLDEDEAKALVESTTSFQSDVVKTLLLIRPILLRGRVEDLVYMNDWLKGFHELAYTKLYLQKLFPYYLELRKGIRFIIHGEVPYYSIELLLNLDKKPEEWKIVARYVVWNIEFTNRLKFEDQIPILKLLARILYPFEDTKTSLKKQLIRHIVGG